MKCVQVRGYRYGVTVSALAFVAACGQGLPKNTEWVDPSPHTERYIVANGVRLYVLDWGGTGDPLLLIPGGGDNPHVFDGIAPQLTDRFHVVGYARREHGRSERRGPQNVDTLVEDLRQLLDSLRFPKANLAGWSVGGNELTRFAELYPERVGRLVYLDAGYDLSAPEKLEVMASMPLVTGWDPSPSDIQSFPAYKRWFAEVSIWRTARWSPAVEAYARDLVTELPDGTLRLEPSDTTAARWRDDRASYRRAYGAVHAPALAIYAAAWLPSDEPDPDLRVALERWTQHAYLPWQRAEIDRFTAGVRDARIHMLARGTHMTFLFTEESELVRIMRAFLLGNGTDR